MRSSKLTDVDGATVSPFGPLIGSLSVSVGWSGPSDGSTAELLVSGASVAAETGE